MRGKNFIYSRLDCASAGASWILPLSLSKERPTFLFLLFNFSLYSFVKLKFCAALLGEGRVVSAYILLDERTNLWLPLLSFPNAVQESQHRNVCRRKCLIGLQYWYVTAFAETVRCENGFTLQEELPAFTLKLFYWGKVLWYLCSLCYTDFGVCFVLETVSVPSVDLKVIFLCHVWLYLHLLWLSDGSNSFVFCWIHLCSVLSQSVLHPGRYYFWMGWIMGSSCRIQIRKGGKWSGDFARLLMVVGQLLFAS